MSSLIRWTPVSDLLSLHNAMDRLFGETFGVSGQSRSVAAVGEGYLPLESDVSPESRPAGRLFVAGPALSPG